MRATGSALLVLALLSGCGNNSSICLKPVPLSESIKTFHETAEPAETPNRAYRMGEFARQCIHRWSYRLARSDESASVTADAVLGACLTPLDNWWMANVEAYDDASEDAKKRVRTEARELALFHVVQARAGKCRIP